MNPYFSVPLTFKVGQKHELDAVDEEFRVLGYWLVPHQSGQSVTNGRLKVQPDLDLAHYSTHASLDWLEIAFETVEKHQALNLHRSLNKALPALFAKAGAFVSGLDRETPYLGRHFVVRLQEATPERVALMCDHLRERCQLVPQPGGDCFLVFGLELAVDFTPRPKEDWTAGRFALERWKMSELLRKHHHVDPSFLDDPRAHPGIKYGGKGRFNRIVRLPASEETPAPDFDIAAELRVSALNPSRHFKPPLDGTYYVGDQNGGRGYRLQDKFTDRRDPEKNEMILLPIAQRRSRIELWLMVQNISKENFGTDEGPYKALRTLRDLHSFSFEQLRSWGFDFRLPTIGQTADGAVAEKRELTIFRRSGAFGLDLYQRAKNDQELREWRAAKRGGRGQKPEGLGKKGRELDYDDLNRKVRDALRGLTKKWSRAKVGFDASDGVTASE